jgi:hypothetical protein
VNDPRLKVACEAIDEQIASLVERLELLRETRAALEQLDRKIAPQESAPPPAAVLGRDHVVALLRQYPARPLGEIARAVYGTDTPSTRSKTRAQLARLGAFGRLPDDAEKTPAAEEPDNVAAASAESLPVDEVPRTPEPELKSAATTTPDEAPEPKRAPSLRAEPGGEPAPSSKRGRLLAYFRAQGRATRAEAARACGMALNHVGVEVSHLAARGYLKVEGPRGSQEIVAVGVDVPVIRRAPEAHASAEASPAPPRAAPVPRVAPPAPIVPVSTPRAPASPGPVSTFDRRTIKVEAITSRDDRFRCLPLSCTLSAGSCVERQAKANGAREGRNSEATASRVTANAHAMCRNCTLGKQVAARLREAGAA